RTLRPARWVILAPRSGMPVIYPFAAPPQPWPIAPAACVPRALRDNGPLPRTPRLAKSAVSSSERPMPLEPAIAVAQLVKLYKTTRALDGISFALEQGSITGLLGGNGAGKTTTIAMIMGLVLPTAGTVKVLGAQMPRQRYQVLHKMNFESPYV